MTTPTDDEVDYWDRDAIEVHKQASFFENEFPNSAVNFMDQCDRVRRLIAALRRWRAEAASANALIDRLRTQIERDGQELVSLRLEMRRDDDDT